MRTRRQLNTTTAESTADHSPFPVPERPAGWPEICLGLWWLTVALMILGFSGLWWATAWPEPKGLAVLRFQLSFAVPIAIGWLAGVSAIIVGCIGMLRGKLSLPARRPTGFVSRRPLSRAV